MFDLLKSCGHPWHVTSTHFLVTLLNLGARDQLVISEQFYQLNRLPAPAPTLPRFYQDRVDRRVQGSQVDKVISQKSRMVMLQNTIQLLANLVRMPNRNQLGQDNASLLSMLYLVVTCGQDQAVVDNPSITHPISMLLHSLVSMFSPSSETISQNLIESLSVGFLPNRLCHASTSTWSYTTLPPYMAGDNHPHNMLTKCLLLPPHSSIRHLLCYLYTQLVMGVTSVDLPGIVSSSDLVTMLNTYKMLWLTMAKDQHYSTWAVLGFMNLMVEGDMEELRVGTESFQALKQLVRLLEHGQHE